MGGRGVKRAFGLVSSYFGLATYIVQKCLVLDIVYFMILFE